MDNIQTNLIAPCGMNCGICGAYLASKNKLKDKGIEIPYCAGCRIRNKQCAFLKKRCDLLLHGKVNFCYECPDFPCENLNHLDKRYRDRFHMSMVNNLRQIKKKGLDNFLSDQNQKWHCPKCAGMVSCHNGLCFHCQTEELKAKKNKYRWE